MDPRVGGHQRLAEALRLVVAGTRPDRVHVAEVRLALRMLERIAVDLGGRCLHQDRVCGARQVERVARPQRPHLERLQRQAGVVERRGRRSQVEDHLRRADHGDRLADVVLDEPEARRTGQVREVLPAAGEIAVDRDHLAAGGEEPVDEMAADEAGAAQDHGFHPPILP